MNPVLLTELRTLLRERRGFLVPMLYAAVLAALCSLALVPSFHDPEPERLGQALAGVVAMAQSIAIWIFAPLVGAAAIAGEREQDTWATLLASQLPRHRVITGKLAARVLYMWLLLSVSLPIAAASLLVHGTDVAEIGGLYLTHAWLSAVLVALGLAVSMAFRRTWTTTLVAIGLTLGLCIFTLALFTAFGGWNSDRYRSILYFNPGLSLFLFFGGDADTSHPWSWWWHYLALGAIGAASLGFVMYRARRVQE
jgi:ABC-type transport system involved in multi-copper enzyme maturation permease subunit